MVVIDWATFGSNVAWVLLGACAIWLLWSDDNDDDEGGFRV